MKRVDKLGHMPQMKPAAFHPDTGKSVNNQQKTRYTERYW